MHITRHAQPPKLGVSYGSTQSLGGEAASLQSWDRTIRQICDLDQRMSRGFDLLKGFLSGPDHNGVVQRFAETDDIRQDFALRDAERVLLATMVLVDTWVTDKPREAGIAFGVGDSAAYGLHNAADGVCLDSPQTRRQQPMPVHQRDRGNTSTERRGRFCTPGWHRITTVQTYNPLHCARLELASRTVREAVPNLHIHPVVGMTKPGGVGHDTLVRLYQTVWDECPRSTKCLLNPATGIVGTDRTSVGDGKGIAVRTISDTEPRRPLRERRGTPGGFSIPELLDEVSRAAPPRRPRENRGPWSFRRDPCRDPGRGIREMRPRGTLHAGAHGHDHCIQRHLDPQRSPQSNRNSTSIAVPDRRTTNLRRRD